jgi:hypothetical protein
MALRYRKYVFLKMYLYHEIMKHKPYFPIDSCYQWRCIAMEIYSIHTHNKNTHLYTSQIILHTWKQIWKKLINRTSHCTV